MSKALKAPVIAGKYTLLRKLGAGGMAEVYLAKQFTSVDGAAADKAFEKLVVIKRIIPHLVSGHGSADFLAMFLDEARLASDLRHPSVVNIIDIGQSGDAPFIVMEFLHGQDVRKVQRKNAAWGEMVPIGHACQIVIDAAAGLHHAHNKRDLNGRALHIVHRDVSPQNIIVTYDGATKIVDFGIAKAASQSTHTQTGVLKGKYTYMSPEQANGEVVDARTDQFALGIVLWELLTMRRLFKRESEVLTLDAIMTGNVPRPTRFREDLPPAVDNVVMKALSLHKEQRYPDCEALAGALEDALAASQIVHSQNKLAQYMRRLFADQLAEEATLGLVNPDGSLTRNFTPFTLPPPAQDRRDEQDRIEAHEGAKPATRVEAPPKASAEEVDDKPDVTAADRKSARSKSVTDPVAPRVAPKPDAGKDRAAGRPSDKVESQTEPTVLEDKRKRPSKADSGTDKVRTRKESRSRVAARPDDRGSRMPLVVASMSAAVVVGAALAWSSWMGSGPGTLVVRSEPRGAVVLLDGVPTGQSTPALLKNVSAGEAHKIRVELGGKHAEEVVTIPRRGDTLDVKLELP